MGDTLLSLRGLTKRYPGVVANNNIGLDILRGEIHTLVGENGAGKSTLIKSLSGSVIPDEGKIVWEGMEYTHITPRLSAQLGIAIVYQEHCLVESLSVAENISLGMKNTKTIFPDFKTYEAKAQDVLGRMGVNIDPRAKVSDLSTAEQQVVEIAKAMSKSVKLMVLDEPTASLTSGEIEMLFSLIMKLKEGGVTIIYISHRMDEVFRVSDRITVLRDGSVIKTLKVSETSRAEIIALMVGRELRETFPQHTFKSDEKALEARNITGNGCKNAGLFIKKGEIVGLAGLLGAGRTELARMIYGADPMESGELFIYGKKVTITSPAKGISQKIGLIPEDRKHQGVLLNFSIEWNTTLSLLKKFSFLSFLHFRKLKDTANKYLQALNIAAPSADSMVANLSGGNQQKVVLAKTMATQSDIVIFDEPTRGIDVGAKQEIYQLMTDMANSGKSILLISSDMAELLGMSDRLYVLAEGKILGELERNEATQIKIMTMISDAMTASTANFIR
ncbi:MAG: sugar ABC transporter ATP-binding protein [Treponema sp.]|jgi:ribose transport system ATP-binding protein|nr:sugar ABC transporter ATP-binding protein [Treponema sp.]